MFEESEIGENMEKNPWWKGLIWFAAGCIATAGAFLVLVIPSVKRDARTGEAAAQRKFTAELARNPVAVELQSVKASLQAATQERDACQERFARQTILYDDSIIIDPTKQWLIPADIEPIILNNRTMSYTHYDPKTKRETVHFRPSKQ